MRKALPGLILLAAVGYGGYWFGKKSCAGYAVGWAHVLRTLPVPDLLG